MKLAELVELTNLHAYLKDQRFILGFNESRALIILREHSASHPTLTPDIQAQMAIGNEAVYWMVCAIRKIASQMFTMHGMSVPTIYVTYESAAETLNNGVDAFVQAIALKRKQQSQQKPEDA